MKFFLFQGKAIIEVVVRCGNNTVEKILTEKTRTRRMLPLCKTTAFYFWQTISRPYVPRVVCITTPAESKLWLQFVHSFIELDDSNRRKVFGWQFTKLHTSVMRRSLFQLVWGKGQNLTEYQPLSDQSQAGVFTRSIKISPVSCSSHVGHLQRHVDETCEAVDEVDRNERILIINVN